ncbi:BARP protein [Trypanosoma brucei brucei TREU927]|uniref:BARP protein n=1 Tax=Trypanosoma brucei brucei (strain 927/4 GUTat10.1) TaxID=185431 RepID=Q38CV5_TRYB2|nr:bloodstream stage alanine-rich protein BARP [Trypanosoma brucei brucei TREU927]EAN77365.1 BARP protein [Trypanosoma brucei brucei TREU927]
MSITFHNLWLLLTVLCTAGIRADASKEECPDKGSYPAAEDVLVLCHVAEQLRGLPDTVSSALVTAAAASSKAFEAKVQAEEAVELAESRGLNVTKAKEAAVRATLAAEAAATAVSYANAHGTKVGSMTEILWEADEELRELVVCKRMDEETIKAAAECTGTAEVVTAQSLSEALEALANLHYGDENVAETLRRKDVVFHKELKSLEGYVEEAVHAQKQAEDAAADANQVATGNSVASPEKSVLLLMAGLFLGSVL